MSSENISYCQHLIKHHLLFSGDFVVVNYDTVIAFVFPSRIVKCSMGKVCHYSS